MQTWLKITLGVLGLSAGAFLYLSLQPTTGQTVLNPQSTSDPALRPTTRLVDAAPAIAGIGPGERPWANQYDDKGELSYQFRAANYEPKDAGTVLVTSPAIRFYITGDQIVQLDGKTGLVYLPSHAAQQKKNGINLPGAGLPSRGTIKDVRISVFQSATDTQPVLTATMDNVAFDNDTLRIATEAFNDGTREIPGDKVPIVIRGETVDFDGEGLTIRINQRDRTIQSLEVTRGTRMVIKDVSMMQGVGGDTKPDGAGSVGRPPAGSPDPTRTPPLALTGPPAGHGTATQPTTSPPQSTSPIATPPEPSALTDPLRRQDVVYRATIRNKVRITQGAETTADGEVLQVDYNMPRARGAGESVSASPSRKPVTPSQGSGKSATRRASDEIIVTWDGPLRLVANAGDPQTPPKQSVTTLMGTATEPTVLRQGSSKATAAAAIFETSGRVATLQGSDAQPVLLEGEGGAVVRTPLLKFDRDTETVRMYGSTVARASVDKDQDGNDRTMLVTWSREAAFRFLRGRIENAILQGDVNVEHPQLLLRASKLDLAFEPGQKKAAGQSPDATGFLAGGADLRRVHAEGNVKAAILDTSTGAAARTGTSPGLAGDTLTLLTSHDTTAGGTTGKLYPSRIESTGNVVASDGKQVLRTDGLYLDLAPDKAGRTAGMGASKVQTLTAVGRVRATAEDKSVATADKMTVTDASGKPAVLLEGPSAGVEGGDGTTRLSAPLIRYSQADGVARIPVPGTLTGIQKSSKPNDPDTKFTVAWTDSAVFDPAQNRIDVRSTPNATGTQGDIRFETTDKDGAVTTARGKTLTVFLADAVATDGKPAPKLDNQLLTRKAMKKVDLGGGVEIQSLLGDANGNLLRQFTLLADQVSYDADGAFNIPVPGRLLVIDKRADPDAKARVNDTMPSGRGTTAMRWRDSLTYNPVTKELAFNGDVLFAHQPLTPADNPAAPDDPFRLEADRMVATLASGPGATNPNDVSSSQIKTVSADGAVYFQGRGVSVRATQIEFDPSGQLLTARGRDRVPVEVDDAKGTGSGRFDSARINLKTGQVEDLTNPTGNVGLGGLKLPGQQAKPPLPTKPPTPSPTPPPAPPRRPR